MSRHSTHSAKPDTLVCTLPEPWLYRAGRRGDAITDLRFIEARLRTNPSLHHIHVADSVRSACPHSVSIEFLVDLCLRQAFSR